MSRSRLEYSTTGFQFTPLREGRRVCYGRIYYEIVFQFTPLREGRLEKIRSGISGETDFNSRPSARGDFADKLRSYRHMISIHAPPRGATRAGLRGVIPTIFQFTPLREGRLNRSGITAIREHFNSRPSARGDAHSPSRCRQPRRISIHAPPRGATSGTERRAICPCISIHAPPRGATSQHPATLPWG